MRQVNLYSLWNAIRAAGREATRRNEPMTVVTTGSNELGQCFGTLEASHFGIALIALQPGQEWTAAQFQSAFDAALRNYARRYATEIGKPVSCVLIEQDRQCVLTTQNIAGSEFRVQPEAK